MARRGKEGEENEEKRQGRKEQGTDNKWLKKCEEIEEESLQREYQRFPTQGQINLV